jgi:hypothetical protein
LIKRKLFIWLAIKTSSFEEYSFAYLILIWGLAKPNHSFAFKSHLCFENSIWGEMFSTFDNIHRI